MLNEPRYDGDAVPLGYLKKLLNTIGQKEERSGSVIVKNFNSPPNPPYYEGWTFSFNGNIYKCIKDRNIGSFSYDDWICIYNKRQSDAIEKTFLFIDDIDFSDQIDGKIETFYQESDPSTSWTTSIEKEKHDGDFWRQKTEEGFKTKIYTKRTTNPVTWEWNLIDVPIILFNTITGHKNIFLTNPVDYETDDLWKRENQYYVSIKKNSVFVEDNWIPTDETVSLKQIQEYYYTLEEVEKKLSILDREIRSDITKSKNEIKIFVEESYTKQETTENIIQKVDSNGKVLEEIKGVSTTGIPTKNLAELTVSLDSLVQRVSRTIEMSDLISKIEGRDTLEVSDGLNYSLIKLQANGYTQSFEYTFPLDDTYPLDDLYPGGVIE